MAVFVLVVIPVAIPTATASSDATGGTIELLEVYPNPLASGDRGEYVTIRVRGTQNLSGVTLSDGEDTVTLPPTVATGRLRLAVGRGMPPNGTTGQLLAVAGRLALANSGETLTLRRDGTVIDRVRYETAPAGDRFVRGADGWTWEPLGGTQFPPYTVRNATVRTFVLPDNAAVPTRILSNATERLWLGGYTFSSKRITHTLCEAREAGTDVRVLVDGDPVGGLTGASRERLDALVACGIELEVLEGTTARYAFHHAKYAVVDDRALILSENWKPSGTGGRANRGWGVLVDSTPFADRLAAVFENDTAWRDTPNWTAVRPMTASSADRSITGERFPTRIEPASMRADGVTLLVAPDNAEAGLLDMIRDAEETIAIQQVGIENDRFSLLAATVAAARRGVSVRILLSGAWYAREDNRIVADRLTRLADREGLPLSVRLVEPGDAFERSHVKGVIVDSEAVFVGSVNWNPHSLRENREVGVIITDEAVGTYYQAVFDRDWDRGESGLLGELSPPPGFAVVVLAVVLGVSIVVVRRFRFGSE